MPAPAGLSIRAAEGADRDALFELVRDFATSFETDRAVYPSVFDALLADSGARLAVAQSDGVPIGYLLGFVHPALYANGPVAWVEEISVAATVRRSGVGRALMADFEAWARARGARLVGLATRRAADFYAALGYERSADYFRKRL